MYPNIFGQRRKVARILKVEGDKDADAEGVGYETPKASSGETPKASRWVGNGEGVSPTPAD